MNVVIDRTTWKLLSLFETERYTMLCWCEEDLVRPWFVTPVLLAQERKLPGLRVLHRSLLRADLLGSDLKDYGTPPLPLLLAARARTLTMS